MRGLILMEVCSSNPACVPSLFALERQFPDVSILENDCMSMCALCEEGPYVLLDGSPLSAEDVPSLIDQLRGRFKELGDFEESPGIE